MMKFRILITVGLAVLLTVPLLAQQIDRAEIKQVTEKYDLGLSKRPSLPMFDLSRINLSHAYSFGFFSGGGTSFSRGLYSGSMTYQIAQPLTLTLNLGILHDPSAIWGDKRIGNSARFLPSGWIDWQPSNNFRLSLGFETIPAYYHTGYGMTGRYRDWQY